MSCAQRHGNKLLTHLTFSLSFSKLESLEDRIAHFTKKGRGPKVKSKEGDILVDDDVSETMDST